MTFEKRLSGQDGILMPNRREFLQLVSVATAGLAVGSNTVAADRTDSTALAEDGDLPEVRVIGTGGTIASTQEAAEDGGYSLNERAEAIVSSVPILEEFAEISFDQPVQKPSPYLTVEDFVEVSRAIMNAADEGVDGVDRHPWDRCD